MIEKREILERNINYERKMAVPRTENLVSEIKNYDRCNRIEIIDKSVNLKADQYEMLKSRVYTHSFKDL